jgi:hypothetical protein
MWGAPDVLQRGRDVEQRQGVLALPKVVSEHFAASIAAIRVHQGNASEMSPCPRLR